MDIIKKIANELSVKPTQVTAVVTLIDEGNTIPFIARYRKEAHGSLDDEQLRKLDERLKYLRGLEERKETILSSIEEQGKLTDELRAQIEAAETLVLLEDLYRPYKQKRRTRATIAKEKGLEPLADAIYNDQTCDPSVLAVDYIDEEKEVKTIEDALAGAMDILAERFSDEADYRTEIRRMTSSQGQVCAVEKSGKGSASSDDDGKHEAGRSSDVLSRGTAKTADNKKLQERKRVYDNHANHAGHGAAPVGADGRRHPLYRRQ